MLKSLGIAAILLITTVPANASCYVCMVDAHVEGHPLNNSFVDDYFTTRKLESQIQDLESKQRQLQYNQQLLRDQQIKNCIRTTTLSQQCYF